MNVRKYLAPTSREALRQVKQDLGSEALILSNRVVDGGIEVLAVAASEAAAKAQPFAPEAARMARQAPDAQKRPQARAVPAEPKPDPEVGKLVKEILSMRGMLEERLAGLAWNEMQRREPVRAVLMREMLRAGFSAVLARQVLERIPAGSDHGRAQTWTRAVLAHNLPVVAPEHDVVERGGVYAVVGPTGVGKTTTAAKLAARCVIRHGADKLALLTTDSYRVGGHEQLRIYGRILGTPVHAVKDAADLSLLLGELRHKHLVLIDTIGMSQRDKMVAEQAALLTDCGAEVKRLLLLNATCNGDTLEDVVRSYRNTGIDGCIITKADEAAGLGTALDALIRHKLPLHAVANGQRVPEDLQLPEVSALIDAALDAVDMQSPHALTDEETPLLFAGIERQAPVRAVAGA